MLDRNDLHPYQLTIADHIVNNCESFPMVDMGLGKTISTLTAIDVLCYQDMAVNKVLIIAPKKVAESVWTDELAKWKHVNHLKISTVIGTATQRKIALMRKADVYVIGRDNVQWLQALYGGAWPFDMLVIDESSSFKNPESKRFKALKRIRPLIDRVVLLSGTPAPNGLMDLWAQMYLLDRGKRLGQTITGYRERFFVKNESGFGYHIRPEGDVMIHERIKDIAISMKSEDYIDLPERVDNFIKVTLPDETLQRYKEFERSAVIQLQEELEITAVNAGALATKLTQCANGAVYDENKVYHAFHDEKLDALEEIIDASQGQPVLVFYWFQHDLARLKRRFNKARELHTKQDIRDWNARKVSLMFAHPMGAGHGLNLQAGGSIAVWFSLTFGLEFYQQANKRLHRQGQVNTVIIHHLVAAGTIDVDIMRAIRKKENAQNALLAAVSARIEKYS